MPEDYHFERYLRPKTLRHRRPLNPDRLRQYLSQYKLAQDVVEYFVKIESYPRISLQDESSYICRIRGGDRLAREKLIQSKLRNVRPIILRQLNRQIDPWDMIQNANQAVVEAVDSYKEGQQSTLGTMISARVKRALSSQALMQAEDFSFSYSTFVRHVLLKQPAAHYWERRSEKDPSANPCRLYTGPARMIRVRQEDRLPCSDLDYNPLYQALKAMLFEELESAIDQLSEREQKVLILRYGLKNGIQRTLKEVSKEFTIATEQVHSTESQRWEGLRHPMWRSRNILHRYRTTSLTPAGVRGVECKSLQKLKHPKRKEKLQQYRERMHWCEEEFWADVEASLCAEKQEPAGRVLVKSEGKVDRSEILLQYYLHGQTKKGKPQRWNL